MAPAPLMYRDHAADDRMAGTRSALAYLPHLLAYPLTGFCLPVIVMVALFVMIGSQSFAGIPMLAFTGIWMLHYLVSVIESTAQGHATPPPMQGDVVFLGGWKTFRALSGPLAVTTAYYGLRDHSPGGATALLATAAFFAPAYLFSLAVDGDIVSALNPLRWLQIVAGMGAAYVFPCVVLGAGAAAIVYVSRTASLGLIAFTVCYVLFVTAHLLGFIAYHRHRKLGIDVHVGNPDDKRRRQEQAARLDTLLAAIDERLKAHDLESAVRVLLAEPGGPANLRGFHEDVFERLASRGQPALLHEQGRRLIAVLLQERRDARALDVFETCENRHPRFEPQTAEHWARLASEARRARLEDRYASMVDALAARYPGDDAAIAARFEQARHCSEQRGDDARARELLAPLLAHTTHPQHAQIVAFARALAQLQPRPG